MKEKQPRSYETYVSYFRSYAMDFFIGEKQASNPNNWYLLFPAFRDWLKLKNSRSGSPIAISTRNHIIVSVNNFLGFLVERGELDANCFIKKCKLFAPDDKNLKGIESVITDEELIVIKPKLREFSKDTEEAAKVLEETGLRFNEFIGLTIDSIYGGKVENKALANELIRSGKENYLGYIVLSCQPAAKGIKREKDGTFERAPLKGRKTISPKNSRIIPIFDSTTWDILVDRVEAAEKLRKTKVYGHAEENYVLFDGFAGSTFSAQLKRAYADTSYKAKSPHDFRHTYCTNLVGETGSQFLTRLILGHRKESTFERYNHIYEQITRHAGRSKNKLMRSNG